MADAPEEEQDVQLERSAEKLLADLQSSLRPFLWKTSTSRKTRIRRQVRVRETDRLVALLEPFQELPQLLDPHLNNLVPILAQAFLANLQSKRPKAEPAHTQLLMPLSRAICRLLYTFCKIRGEKVIVRFLSTETRHLELLLSAIEAGSHSDEASPIDCHDVWDWEERYVTLLWLSQLLLAPFDLASISSADAADTVPPTIPGLNWPANAPGVTLRVIPLAIKYLSSAGKERDAAKVLLVRVAMRKDMQELGILHALIQWSFSSLRPSSDIEHSTYYYIGVLSFLSGILVSSTGTGDMVSYLKSSFSIVQDISEAATPVSKVINASAVARKTIIKILRTISVQLLQSPETVESGEVVETTIGHMLESLKDSATPVRLAASKALSVITLKLAPDMADQVVEAVLDSLKQKSFLVKVPGGRYRDLSGVNPLEWHGLILTLSHLLYRRSPPARSLSQILPALLTGLSFEQRSSSGSSIGTNVRDAANFGIWALARRYTTEELQAVAIDFTQTGMQGSSVLQMLATSLVVAASLDPAGNIRRGSSAALQELIGRHPDTIAEGIQVVQVVDYHAVALRSRAARDVSLKAAKLSHYYLAALLDAILGWRGVGDGDTSARRNTAAAFADLVWTIPRASNEPLTAFRNMVDRVEMQIGGIQKHQVSELHGLVLCLTSVLARLNAELSKGGFREEVSHRPQGLISTIQKSKVMVATMLQSAESSWFTYRRQELTAEAVANLAVVACQLLRVDATFKWFEQHPLNPAQFTPIEAALIDLTRSTIQGPLSEVQASPLATISNSISPSNVQNEAPLFENAVGTIQLAYNTGVPPDQALLVQIRELLENRLLPRTETEVVDASSGAAAALFFLIRNEERPQLTNQWNAAMIGSKRDQGNGFIQSLFEILPLATPEIRIGIIKAIHQRWAATDIDIRTLVLSCLAKYPALLVHTDDFLDIVEAGIDDYTTNVRGDVGSLLRIEAVKAAGAIFRQIETLLNEVGADRIRHLFGKVLRVSVEKLDKIRIEAQGALSLTPVIWDIAFPNTKTLNARTIELFKTYPPSSKQYFTFLLQNTFENNSLEHGQASQMRTGMIEGYVTSADTGSEDLVRASRAALAEACQDDVLRLRLRNTMCEVLKRNLSNDRILVSAMEVIAFLFDAGIMQKNATGSVNVPDDAMNWSDLYLLIQKAHYKTGNVRRLEAAIKLYSGLVEVYPKALDKLVGLLLHPFPKVRNQAADSIFVIRGVCKGVNWAKAKKADVEDLKRELPVS